MVCRPCIRIALPCVRVTGKRFVTVGITSETVLDPAGCKTRHSFKGEIPVASNVLLIFFTVYVKARAFISNL